MLDLMSNPVAVRFAVAAEQLLRQDLDPKFANDGQSVALFVGAPLDPYQLAQFAVIAKKTGADIVHFAFDPAWPQSRLKHVDVFAERYGVVFRWTECDLWAPADGGPLLIMPKGLNVCFGYDGLALISLEERPTHALGEGIARARTRLRFAAAAVTEEQLAAVERTGRLAAA
jgi:hypothetical protein